MDSILHHFRKLFGVRHECDTPDSQLVDRFISCQDESAFETLLHRHASLVWGVCRRMLKDSHLAEDAFQATFLLLARKAHSIQNKHSVGSWLYGVAYRLAHRARADSIRRQHREELTGPIGESDVVTELIRRELRPVLDEELHSLPEKYSAPLILCYLQGKTHEQAARELGWPSGTISRRLNKGRDLLRERLTLRGVTLSTFLLTTVLAEESTAAVPAGLVATTRWAAFLFAAGKMATGAVVSSSAAALAEAMIKSAAVAKLKVAAVVTLIGILVATGTGALILRATNASRVQDDPHSNPEVKARGLSLLKPAADSAEVAHPAITAGGRVVDRNGKPIAGAKVYLSEWSEKNPAFQSLFDFKSVIGQTVTDNRGRFQFKDARISNPGACLWDLEIAAPGYGLAFKRALFEDDDTGSTFILGPGATVNGLLVDRENRPVRGARVELLSIACLHDPAFPSRWSTGNLYLAPSDIPTRSKTDDTGEFVLPGMPKDVRLTLLISHDDFERERIYVSTTKQRSPDLFDRRGGEIVPRSEPVYSSRFTHALKAAHRIRGRIVQDDDGLAVAGARLWVKQLTLGDQSPYSSDDFSTTTNRHGDFTVSGLRAGRYTIHVAPPRGSQYLAPYAEAEIQATASDHEITLRLARGGMVHGKVLDRETGSGLSGVTIEHERRIPGHDGLADSVWEKIQAQTGAGGVFCMTLPSGKFDVSIVRPVLGYATPLPKTVDVRAGLPIEEVLFSLDHGRVIAGQVLDPEGIPIKGVRVDALWDESEHPRTVTDSNGQFVMAGDSFSALRFIHYERRLGALIREKDLFAQKSDLKIRLRALGRVRGTIVDDDHHPIPGALVQLNYNKEDGSGTVANVLVGLDGKFEFASMVFSCPHELEAWANGYTRFHRELGIVENGQIQELQEIRLHKIDSLDRRVHDR